MSERTEQLILMLTPEEKALIEGIAREWNQTPADYLLELVHEKDTLVEADDEVDIEGNIRQAMQEIREGKARPITSVWDILDKPIEEEARE